MSIVLFPCPPLSSFLNLNDTLSQSPCLEICSIIPQLNTKYPLCIRPFKNLYFRASSTTFKQFPLKWVYSFFLSSAASLLWFHRTIESLQNSWTKNVCGPLLWSRTHRSTRAVRLERHQHGPSPLGMRRCIFHNLICQKKSPWGERDWEKEKRITCKQTT